jgi:hypothetical protein
MTPQDVDRNDPRRSSFESACRDFWIAFVRTETGERPGDGTTLAKEGAALTLKLERLDRNKSTGGHG